MTGYKFKRLIKKNELRQKFNRSLIKVKSIVWKVEVLKKNQRNIQKTEKWLWSQKKYVLKELKEVEGNQETRTNFVNKISETDHLDDGPEKVPVTDNWIKKETYPVWKDK